MKKNTSEHQQQQRLDEKSCVLRNSRRFPQNKSHQYRSQH